MTSPLPRITADLPGTGGAYKQTPSDFVVEEVPAYLPSGEGPHTFLWIEKEGVDTFEATQRLAAALGVPAREAGYAGMKDKHARTRQWISLPGVDPARALGLELPGLRVLEARRHGNKLKTGHLRGNRFSLALRGCVPDAEPRARAIAAALEDRGLPNFYGEQRFGHEGRNAEAGLAIVRGTQPLRDPRRARLLVSALQSDLFNRWLGARLAAGTLRAVRAGEILEKVESGGLFTSTEPEVDQARCLAWEVAPTGPMFGWKMRRPPEGTTPRSEEDASLAAAGLDLEAFAAPAVRRIAEGTRRAAVVRPGALSVRVEEGALWVAFSLPPGSYATVLLGEFIGDTGASGR